MKHQEPLTTKRRGLIMEDMKPLRQMLKDWRAVLHITSADAARRCGLSPQLYWQIENETKTPSVGTLLKLARGTGIPVERLLEAAAMQSSGTPLVTA